MVSLRDGLKFVSSPSFSVGRAALLPPTTCDNRNLTVDAPTKNYHCHCVGVSPHPRVASLALRAIHLLAIRSPSVPSRDGQCFALLGMRIATSLCSSQ